MGKAPESSSAPGLSGSAPCTQQELALGHVAGAWGVPRHPCWQPALLRWGSGPALASSAALPQSLRAEGGARPQPEVGREQMLAGQEKTILQRLQSKLWTSGQHCAEQGWVGALSPPASSVGLGPRSSLWLQGGGNHEAPSGAPELPSLSSVMGAVGMGEG